jgi:hypothetical protein
MTEEVKLVHPDSGALVITGEATADQYLEVGYVYADPTDQAATEAPGESGSSTTDAEGPKASGRKNP